MGFETDFDWSSSGIQTPIALTSERARTCIVFRPSWIRTRVGLSSSGIRTSIALTSKKIRTYIAKENRIRNRIITLN